MERLFNVIEDPDELVDLSGDPDLASVMLRMRKALDDWRGRVGDLSDIPESALVEQIAPGGNTGITPPPRIRFDDGRVLISSEVDGASIGYRLDEQPWQVYSKPIALPAGTRLRAKAVRYGWEASEEIDIGTP